jgi:hypothetical protein
MELGYATAIEPRFPQWEVFKDRVRLFSDFAS